MAMIPAVGGSSARRNPAPSPAPAAFQACPSNCPCGTLPDFCVPGARRSLYTGTTAREVPSRCARQRLGQPHTFLHTRVHGRNKGNNVRCAHARVLPRMPAHVDRSGCLFVSWNAASVIASGEPSSVKTQRLWLLSDAVTSKTKQRECLFAVNKSRNTAGSVSRLTLKFERIQQALP